MHNQYYISNYCVVQNGNAYLNGGPAVLSQNIPTFTELIKSLYNHYKLDYPKLFKMDDLCKLAFISSEILLKELRIKEKYKDDEVGIVMSNASSTLNIDAKHFNTIKDKNNYFPSPALFVYTLPNIMIGEISIKNKFTGENYFFISEKFDPAFMSDYVNSLLETNKIKACLCGWMELNGDNYNGLIYLVEKTGTLAHQTIEIEKLIYPKK